MAGGQSGQSWLGENNVWISALTAGVVLLLGFGPRACERADPTPVEKHATECQEAWSDNEKGKADDEDKTLLATDFCDTNNRLAVAEVQTNQQIELQEAQSEQQAELQEANAP
jgi:hypothetical protein